MNNVIDFANSALTLASESARIYASAKQARNTVYESPSLFSDLAYKEARMAVQLARLIQELREDER